MIEGGFVIFIIGFLMAFSTTVERAIIHRRDDDTAAGSSPPLGCAKTAHSMQPITELGGDAFFFRRYDPHGARSDIAKQIANTQPGDGARFLGRGYVQLTDRADQVEASAKLGVGLMAHPERALEDDIAAKAMRRGMQEGWLTNHGFADFLPGSGPARLDLFTEARRIINGTDCAAVIAGYALQLEQALIAGGWS